MTEQAVKSAATLIATMMGFTRTSYTARSSAMRALSASFWGDAQRRARNPWRD
jgi:hypothetical protein